MGRAFPEAGRYIAIERATGWRWLLGSRVIDSEVVVYDQDGPPTDFDPIGAIVERFPSFGATDIALASHGWDADYEGAYAPHRFKRPMSFTPVEPVGEAELRRRARETPDAAT